MSGFAKTLERQVELEPPVDRYVEMIIAATAQLGELVDELGVAARIEDERYEPHRQQVDTLVLAHAAAARLGEERVSVDGEGAAVSTDIAAVERGVAALVQSVLRHGGLEATAIHVDATEIAVDGVSDASAPVVLGEDLRDLGAAVAVRLLRALGGSVERDGGTLRIRLAG